MDIEVFLQGTKVIVRATWKTESVPASGDYNTLTDPTTITFSARRRKPDGSMEAKTDYVFGVASEITKVSTGTYEFAKALAVGRWYVHAQGTGVAEGSGRVSFEIDESEALAA